MFRARALLATGLLLLSNGAYKAMQCAYWGVGGWVGVGVGWGVGGRMDHED